MMTRRMDAYWLERAEKASAAAERRLINVEEALIAADVEAGLNGEERLLARWSADPQFRAEFIEDLLVERGGGINYAEWDSEFRCPWGIVPPDDE